MSHDPRCLSLTGDEPHKMCDCRVLALLDERCPRCGHPAGDGWRWLLLDGFTDEAPLIVPTAELKALRETLARAQSGRLTPEDSDRLNGIIAEIDRNRPLGPDGKHGNLHTPTCGCDDR